MNRNFRLHWFLSLVGALLYSASLLAHTPVPLKFVPEKVITAVKFRMPALQLTEASVDVEGTVIMYVVMGNTDDGEFVLEVTAEGTVIQIYDREDYVEHIED